MKFFVLIGFTFLLTSSASAQSSKEECASRLVQAQKAGIIYGLKVEPPLVTLVVDERAWNNVDFSTKTGFAETTLCAMLGPDKSSYLSVKVDIRSQLTNRIIGQWRMGELSVP